jgi:murein DD-endopeptidase MepM/ murein hydrolase activator NlpD
MKSIKFILPAILLCGIFFQAPAQEDYIRQRQQDFERYRQERARDFQNFVEEREKELRRMEKAYQDYYNELHGLRSHYLERNDTERAAIVQEIIEFENQVAEVTGKEIQVTESVVISEEAKDERSGKSEYDDTSAPTDTSGAVRAADPRIVLEETPEIIKTTFIPLPEEGSRVPVLTPLPEKNARITSPFGMRYHPILKRQRMHNGIDFGSGMNAEVFAAANGMVKLAQYSNSFGNWIIVEHQNGYTSVYAHLSSFKVKKNDLVKKGDLIGYTGSTGRSTGPHLHYEVRLNGTPVNPVGYLAEFLK